jgi:polygalacturonase
MKIICKLLILLVVLLSCSETEKVKTITEITPWGNELFTIPTINSKNYTIIDYGAKQDAENNQKAIQQTIDECHKNGGGKIVIPKGIWKTSFLNLKSNINFHLEEGATLLFSDKIEDYKVPTFTRWEGMECMNYHPPIYANNVSNVIISGKGKIDGNGKNWWKFKKQQMKTLPKLYDFVMKGVAPHKRNLLEIDGGSTLRPSLIQFINSKNIMVREIEIGSGPMWTVHFVYCENVIAQKLRVITKGANNDGIIPDASKKVLIDDCFFSTGDDCIVIKSGLNEDGWRVNKPCERIVIKNCKTAHGHGGVVCGSEMSGGIKNVYAYNCKFNNTDRGLRFKTMKGRGGYIKNLWFKNIEMNNIKGEAIIINMKYGGSSIQPRGDKMPELANFNFDNIKSSNSKTCIKVIGADNHKIKDISLKNINMSGKNGWSLENIVSAKFENIQFESKQGEPIRIKNCEDLTFSNIRVKSPNKTIFKSEGKNSNVLINGYNDKDFEKLGI